MPAKSFHVEVGRLLMTLARTAIASGDRDSQLPLGGLSAFELAVFELPQAGSSGLDWSALPVRGWETVVRAKSGANSAMVVVRPAAAPAIADLVLIVGGEKQVLYGRLRGRLDPDLPRALAGVAERRGPEGVRGALIEATREARPSDSSGPGWRPE